MGSSATIRRHSWLRILGALLSGADGKGRKFASAVRKRLFPRGAAHVHFDLSGTASPPMPERDFSWPVYDIFDTSDGRQIFLAVVTDGHWQSACRMFGFGDLLAEPALQSPMGRIDGRDRFLPRFAEALAARPLDELCRLFDSANIPYSPINRPQDMYEDPHVNRPGGLTPSRNADGALFRTPSLPIEFDRNGLSAQSNVPAVGADTGAVLASLGYSAGEIAELTRNRAEAA